MDARVPLLQEQRRDAQRFALEGAPLIIESGSVRARSTFDEAGADSISLQSANDELSTREWNTDLHLFRRSGTWRPNFQFIYRREFGDLNTTANVNFAGNPSNIFATQGTPIPRDTVEGTAGITMRSGKGLLWTLEYHFFKNSDETRNGLRWKLRL